MYILLRAMVWMERILRILPVVWWKFDTHWIVINNRVWYY